MGKTLNLTKEESDQFGQRIENFMEFTREVLNDPSILEHIPSGSNVEAVFHDQRNPDEHYDIETPRMVAKVTPPSELDSEDNRNSGSSHESISAGRGPRGSTR